MSMYMRQKAYSCWHSIDPVETYAHYMFNREFSSRWYAWGINAII